MATSPRTWNEALLWLSNQADAPSRSWAGMCQMLARSSYGIGGGFASAWLQWVGAASDSKHVGGTVADAPVGAALFWRSSSPFGHVAIKGRNFPDGSASIWSNDIISAGAVDRVLATRPATQWGQQYLGYTTELNTVDLRLDKPGPPKPKLKPYKALGRAIDRLEHARDVARRHKDTADVEALTTEINRLTKLHAKLRRR